MRPSPSRFNNPHPEAPHGFLQILRWKLGLGPSEDPAIPDAPNTPAERVAPDLARIANPDPAAIQATWLGHAGWLIQTGGFSLLVDPIFSTHCFPLPFPSLRRLQPSALTIAELPPLDAVLITHGHYDHLDLPTLHALSGAPPLIVAEGHASLLRRKGLSNITEVPWWETHEPSSGLRLHALPAQHFSARTPFDRNRAHWCGWLIEAAGKKIYHAGDTAYGPFFADIGDRFGPIDLAILPIGAYSPRWVMESVHVTPPEAVRIHREIKARWSLASHWGTFQLTDEALSEPPLWLEKECAREGLEPGRFQCLKIGESFLLQEGKTPRLISGAHPDPESRETRS